jgi:hypothetical protein
MSIPFASLLGLQAALQPLVHKQPAPEAAVIDGVDFVDPRPGAPRSAVPYRRHASPPRRRFFPCPTERPIKYRLYISGQSSEWVLADGVFVHFANAI